MLHLLTYNQYSNIQMGNTQPPEATEYIHQRLGRVKLVPLPPNAQNVSGTAMIKTIPINSQKELESWQQGLSKIKNRQTMDVLFLPSKHTYESGYCGTSGLVTLWYEDYIFVLSNEIRNRERLDKPFLEIEIWYLLYNMIRAAKEFEKFNRKIGDIRPANIVINQDGQIKIISTLSCPGELTNFQKAIQSREQEVYLAPEQCNNESIKVNYYPNTLSPTAAEMFSIGVTLLEAAILKNCNDLYQRNPYFFHNDLLQRFKAELKASSYSESLKQLISRMTETNPKVRPKASEIHQTLYPFENEILNLEEHKYPMVVPQQQPVSPQYSDYQPQSYSLHQPNLNRPYSPPVQGLVPRSTSPSYKVESVTYTRGQMQYQPGPYKQY